MAEVEQNAKPKVSVVIPAYNEELELGATLDTITSQEYSEAFEIIVCDNNSTDKTAEIAAAHGAKVVTETRKGSRFAYDTGMRTAQGEYILVTNADVRLPKDWITRIIHEYSDPEVVGVGTKVEYYNAPDWINFVLKSLDKLSPKAAMWGPSMSCRRDVFYKVGGINHGVNTNEDAIFTLLIEKLGKVKIIKDMYVQMDGRRFNNGFVSAFQQWVKSYGLNSMYIQFHYFFSGEIKTYVRDFGDVRAQTFGQGEQVQLSVIIPVSNDQQHISRVLSDLEAQTFDRRFRVYVLNESSTDLTLQIAKLYPSVTTINYAGVYDLGSKLKLLLKEITSPVVAITSSQAHLPTDWLEEIYQQFNKQRSKQLQILSGPYVNELARMVSAITNQTLDRMSNRIEFTNVSMLTQIAREVFDDKGNAEQLLEKLETAVRDRDLNVQYSANFKSTFVNDEGLASTFTTGASSVKHSLKKLFKL